MYVDALIELMRLMHLMWCTLPFGQLFDKVLHNSLISKVETLYVKGIPIALAQILPSNCQQRIMVNLSFSNWRKAKSDLYQRLL